MRKILKNGKELIIRQPVREDAVGLIEHMLAVDSETRFLGREPNEFNFTLEQEEVFIAAQLENTKQCFLVGEIDNEVVANITVSNVRGYRRFLHRATMGITIQKKCWGMGIGKVLMEKAIEWCKQSYK